MPAYSWRLSTCLVILAASFVQGAEESTSMIEEVYLRAWALVQQDAGRRPIAERQERLQAPPSDRMPLRDLVTIASVRTGLNAEELGRSFTSDQLYSLKEDVPENASLLPDPGRVRVFRLTGSAAPIRFRGETIYVGSYYYFLYPNGLTLSGNSAIISNPYQFCQDPTMRIVNFARFNLPNGELRNPKGACLYTPEWLLALRASR